VHQGGLVVFRPMVQEILNIEQFFQRKFNKIKTNYLKKLMQASPSFHCWKGLDE
jgi:hypothetical protein